MEAKLTMIIVIFEAIWAETVIYSVINFLTFILLH